MRAALVDRRGLLTHEPNHLNHLTEIRAAEGHAQNSSDLRPRSNHDIAHELSLSTNTVRNHVATIPLPRGGLGWRSHG